MLKYQITSPMHLWGFSSFSKCLEMEEHRVHFSTFSVFIFPGPTKDIQMYKEQIQYRSSETKG